MLKRLSKKYVFMDEETGAEVITPAAGDEPVDEGVDSDAWGDLVENEVPGQGAELSQAGSEDDFPVPKAPVATVDDDVPEVPPTSQEPAPTPEPEPTVPPEPESEPTPEPEPEPQPEPEPKEEPPKQLSEEERKALYAEAHKQLTQRYGLNEADAALMQTEPEKVLPQLAANLHMQIYNDVIASIMQYLPSVVTQHVTGMETQKKHTSSFYSRWPKLAKHKTEVANFARLYGQLYPNATAEEAAESIGKHVMIELGYPLDAPSESPPPAGTPTAASAPHVPAGQSSVTEHPTAPKPSENPWSAFVEDLEED